MTTPKPVVLFGVGDLARLAHVYLRDDSPYEVAAFTVTEEYRSGDSFRGLPLVPFERIDSEYPPDEVAMFVAIGYSRTNRNRRGVYEQCKQRGYELITYVNSRAQRAAEVEVGDNVFVFEDNVLQPFVTIGNDVILWSGNHIGHDTRIGDHCFVASHAVISGHVTIGESCFVGVNATLRDGVTVAPDCVIGAGALIMKDTEPGGVYSVRGTEPSGTKSWELASF